MQTSLRIAIGIIILTLACPIVWAAEPAIVFVDEAKAGAKSIMVMDADGGSRTEVFRTSKRFCDCGGPTLSPAISPDGQWVAFLYAGEGSTTGKDILKLSSSGGTPEVILCGSGDTGYYVVPETPQWSPDGTRIAAFLRNYPDGTTDSIVLLDTDGAPGCPYFPTNIEVVYSGLPDPDYHLFRGIAWSPDGSQIALLEDPDSDPSTPYFLTIVDVENPTKTHYQFMLPVGYVDDSMWVRLESLDWQRSGSNMIFAFETMGSWNNSNRNRFEDIWLLEVTQNSDVTVTELTAGQSPTWAPDDSQLLVGASWWDDSTEQMVRVSFPDLQVETLGTGYDPDWRRSAPECSSTADCLGDEVCCGGVCIAPSPCVSQGCDDEESCTIDSCDPCTGCSYEPNPECEPPPAECSSYPTSQTCKADSACRWHKKRGCVNR